MCGIVGKVSKRPIDESEIRRANNLMTHRGPDDSGVLCLRGARWQAGLGSRRLSILDCSPRGRQPISNAAGDAHIVYNGELYNFREIRKELEAEGTQFHTGTDTEVVLQAYLRWGIACLQRFNGMFAFAIWDGARDSLTLVRDRLGVKPLYYCRQPDGVIFASEVKALLQFSEVPRKLNRDAIAKYLAYLWVPDPETLFDGIFKLPPGHYATLQDGQWDIQPYWDLQPPTVPMRISEEEACGEILARLRRSIQRRLVSDVPVGVFLSGGLDSSLITMLMKEFVQEPIRTCTVAFSQSDLRHDILTDDLKYARRVRGLMTDRLDYSEIIFRPEFARLLPKIVWHMDEPVADPAAISTHLICTAAKAKATVMLTGVGGEELFAGYPRHRAMRVARWAAQVPSAMRNGFLHAISRRLSASRPGNLMVFNRNFKKFVRALEGKDAIEQYLLMRSYYTTIELDGLLLNGSGANVHEEHCEYFRRVRSLDWLTQLLYVDTKTFLPCLNLTYMDKASMAASVELREPLLDHEFVEFASQLPPGFKLRGLKSKYILKKAAERILPKQLVWRKKAGFSAPVRAWLAGELGPVVDELLSKQVVMQRGVLQYSAVQQIIEEQRSGREDNALRIWALLTLEIWMRTFLDGDGSRALEPESAAQAYEHVGSAA